MPHPSQRTMTAVALVVTLAVAGGCGLIGSATPGPTASATTPATTPAPTTTSAASSSPTVRPTTTPPPARTTTRAPAARPDLRIGLAPGGTCVWYLDTAGDIWINPLIKVTATGTVPSLVSFNMVSNYSKFTAGGGLHPNVAQTWAIDMGPAAPSAVVTLTLRVDPTFEVAESNEGNNVGTIHVNLVGARPPTTTEATVPCS